jgi:hypothetical protein
MYYILLTSDIIEIIFYASVLYTFCRWLKTDKTKNILIYFLAYCTFTLIAWVVQLPTLTPLLFSYAPVALLLFIVLHEKTLQRNLVTLCSITPAKIQHEDWLDTLLSSSLATINTNKSITVVIEHQNSLEHFLNAPFLINAVMGKGILDILLSSTSYDEHKMVWIDTNGRIRGINVSWINYQEKEQLRPVHFLHKENALFYTFQTDAIVLSAHPISRTFTLIINGQETTHLSAHQVHTMIKKQLSLKISKQHKGAYRENIATEKSLS